MSHTEQKKTIIKSVFIKKVKRRKYLAGKQKKGNCCVKEFVALPSMPLRAQPGLLRACFSVSWGNRPRSPVQLVLCWHVPRLCLLQEGDGAHKELRGLYRSDGADPPVPR